ncbi:MAG: iron-siderophore ABC transporter substrate-binding protein [Chloroflexota bacterium]
MRLSKYIICSLLLLSLLVACVPLEQAAMTATDSSGETASSDGTSDGSFPTNIDHKYGSTTIESKPDRIVTVGLTDHDALLALGIVPVGTTEWFGGYEGSIWPWAQDELEALDGEVPEPVGGDGINFEAIAALQPDLILALFSGVTEDEYELLSQIAPTVAQPGEHTDWGIPWQELTLTVGKAIGQEAEAGALVADVDARFAQVREEHPQFQEAVSIVATPYQGLWLYGPEDIRGRLLTDLGFSLPEGIEEVVGDSFGANLSQEKADMLEIDVVIWFANPEEAVEAGGPVYETLAVHTENREVFLPEDNPIYGATSFVTVLSLPYLLEGLVPQLDEALEKRQ